MNIRDHIMAAAQLNDALDHDWSYIEEQLCDLERIHGCMENSLLREACGIVVAQCYLNMLKRSLSEHGYPLEEVAD